MELSGHFNSSSSSNFSSRSDTTEVAPNSLIHNFPRAPSTSDSIRLKCREMLANALQTGGHPVLLCRLQLCFRSCVFNSLFFLLQRITLLSVLTVRSWERRSKNISFTFERLESEGSRQTKMETIIAEPRCSLLVA